MTFVYRLRRITVFFAIAALLIGAFSVMAVAMPSDLNGDGNTDTSDVRLLLLSLVEEYELTEEQRLAADLNGDGQVTSADVRALLCNTVQDVTTTTAPEALTSTRPTVSTTTSATVTTTVTTVTGIATTTVSTVPSAVSTTDTTVQTTTTVPDCVTTNTTYPTTMPYGAITVTVDSMLVRAGDLFTLPVRVSDNHALVGFEMELEYDPSALTLINVNDDICNPYATGLNAAVFDEQAQWRFTKPEDGILRVRYVSKATTGDPVGGVLFSLTFELNDDVEWDPVVFCRMPSHLSCADGLSYVPSVSTEDGTIRVASRTTRTTTTGTTDAAVPTTNTTYPPTTTTTWVLTGPDGTAPTVWTTTTEPMPDCVSTFTTTYPTTLPYGGPLHFTGETVMARVGETFDWTVSVSEFHYLVGLELEIHYDPTALTFAEIVNVNESFFAERAQWRFTLIEEGILSLRYVSNASTGTSAGGELFTLSFLLRADTDVDESPVRFFIPSYLSAAFGIEFEPIDLITTDGLVEVASRSTRPKTTTAPITTNTTLTTTTTWVLTGPDGTAPTTMPPTTCTTTYTVYPTTTTTFVYDG